MKWRLQGRGENLKNNVRLAQVSLRLGVDAVPSCAFRAWPQRSPAPPRRDQGARARRWRRWHRRARGRHRAAQGAAATQAARALFAGAGAGAGAALQAAAVSVGTRARAPGQRAAAHAYAGQDLVPEPSLQVQETAPGQVPRTGGPPPSAAPGGGASAGAGWQALPRPRRAGLSRAL